MSGHAPRIRSCHADHARKAIWTGRAEPKSKIEVEILQLIRTDDGLGIAVFRLRLPRWHQFGADLRLQNLDQRLTRLRTEPMSLCDPSYYVLDQGLRHARVDGVMRHVVADAVGTPSERQLAEVTGADDHRVVQIGEPEQMVGALARLYVLEGDVVVVVAADVRMADVLEHLQADGRISSSCASQSIAP